MLFHHSSYCSFIVIISPSDLLTNRIDLSVPSHLPLSELKHSQKPRRNITRRVRTHSRLSLRLSLNFVSNQHRCIRHTHNHLACCLCSAVNTRGTNRFFVTHNERNELEPSIGCCLAYESTVRNRDEQMWRVHYIRYERHRSALLAEQQYQSFSKRPYNGCGLTRNPSHTQPHHTHTCTNESSRTYCFVRRTVGFGIDGGHIELCYLFIPNRFIDN